ncbi:four helix bundle protein [Joostella atrarenae]|uniref:four helix bundle protein n=1 Tax=Joostella atrarenae TaxID=679257 RepID=UPI00293E9436|nr:four helix bundle protein [Joostella atrarenae]
MTQRHNYKNLNIWKIGLEIANLISDIIIDFPKFERYDLSSQISRCSVSIPSNIAEGSGRSDKAFCNFLDYSISPSYELENSIINRTP